MSEKAPSIIDELTRAIEGHVGVLAPRAVARSCWAVIERRCAAAGKAAEAAGPTMPAREQRPAGEIIAGILTDVCELPDRTSPDDAPEDVTMSLDELRRILEAHLTPS